VDALTKAGLPLDHIIYAPQKTLDVPGSMDSTGSALPKLPSSAKNLIVGGMNDNTVLGGVRAASSAFKPTNLIGIGINGTDAIDELKKKESGFFGSMLPSPDKEGYNTALQMYEWVKDGKEPPKYTAMEDVTLITRANFQEVLTKIGLWK
jgi:L-arabinose transport system substrate-binding protein